MLRGNNYEKAFALRNGNKLLCCPNMYRTCAICLRWFLNLAFVTQRGACDPAYNFTVNVSNGVVTHPNLLKFKGYVTKSGAVRASVTVHDKYASGLGRLSSASGRGTWSGDQEMRGVRATGPRNEIDIATKANARSLPALRF